MVDGIIAEPIFIEEVEDQGGFICFKIDKEKFDGKKYDTIRAHEDELFFDDYEWIEHIISQERSYPIEIDMRRIKKKNEEFMKEYRKKHGKDDL